MCHHDVQVRCRYWSTDTGRYRSNRTCKSKRADTTADGTLAGRMALKQLHASIILETGALSHITRPRSSQEVVPAQDSLLVEAPPETVTPRVFAPWLSRQPPPPNNSLPPHLHLPPVKYIARDGAHALPIYSLEYIQSLPLGPQYWVSGSFSEKTLPPAGAFKICRMTAETT